MTTLEGLERSRTREKRQTLFYRALASEAERRGLAEVAERLNELHADEQHHLSRLTARVLELGGAPADLRKEPVPEHEFEAWEALARRREGEEVEWYEALLEDLEDAATRTVVEEILASERMHRAELGGKWMSA